ncbi:MAG: ankyrin repeat domain-containing protein, partial [Candidatus Wallbacteria bacterium]|nr:ankyrin repeat domain-containing protein [Candidatus Wallbacteria bacterium]
LYLYNTETSRECSNEIRSLIDSGADMNAADVSGRTPLILSLIIGLDEIAELLVRTKGCSLDLCDRSGNSSLSIAITCGRDRIARQLIEDGACIDSSDSNGCTPLLLALAGGKKEIADLLLSKGSSVTAVRGRTAFPGNEDGFTMLMYAAKWSYPDVIKILIQRGARINDQSKNGSTALMVACEAKSVDAVNTLLESGADPNIRDQNGNNSLMRFLSSCRSDTDCAIPEALIRSGSDLAGKNGKGFTPYVLAVRMKRSDIADLIASKGIDPCPDRLSADLLLWSSAITGDLKNAGLAVSRGAELNYLDTAEQEYGCSGSPLQIAAGRANPEMVRFLLSKGAVVSLPDKHGETALLKACGSYGDSDKKQETISILKMAGADYDRELTYYNNRRYGHDLEYACSSGKKDDLLKYIGMKVSVNRSDEYGRTPLMLASEKAEHSEIVEILLDNGADPTARDLLGLTALDHAKQCNSEENYRLISQVLAKIYYDQDKSMSCKTKAESNDLSMTSSEVKAESATTSGTVKTILLGNNVKLEMVWIPPGQSVKGSVKGAYYEQPQHIVKISKGFYLGRYELTEEQWEAVAVTNPRFFYKGAKIPVNNISWDDSQEFISKLNQATGHAFRLPTETEWEYACRAGTTTEYYWGDKMDGDFCWYEENSGEICRDVGTRKPNAWGLYDMSGNESEWCQDWGVGGDYYKAASAASSQNQGDNPTGVQRGGSHYNSPINCRSASRLYNSRSPNGRDIGSGMRLAADEIP